MSPGTGPLLLLLLFCAGSAAVRLTTEDLTKDGKGLGIPYPLTKPGTCPADVESPKCDDPSVVFTDECTVDQDCNGNMKCCFSGCRRRCRQPLDAKNNACPYFNNSQCVHIRPGPAECHRDDQCQGTERCCYYFCQFQCKPTVKVKPGLCPIPLTRCAGTPPPPLCLKDSDCTGNKKCCTKFCRQACENPRPGKYPVEVDQ